MDIEKVTRALTTGSDGLIGKLAEGLQHFIGYSGTKTSSGPIITGGGILSANVAKHQVCNALLNFVIRFLEGLCGIKELKDDTNKSKVLEVIGTLRKCVGTGQVPEGFKDLVQKIGDKVEQGFDKKINSRGSNGTLNNVFHALKDILEKSFSSEDQTHKVEDEAQNVQNYIDAVNRSVQEDGSGNFRNLSRYLQDLFGKEPINPQSSGLSDDAPLKIDSLNGDISNVNTYTNKVNGEIGNLKKGRFINHANAAVFSAVRDAATAFISELQTKAYTSYYDKADLRNVSRDDDKAKCAKIFLGCLPLYYQALTYIYWGCHDNGGRWGNLTLANGALRSYFDSQGLLPTFVESSRTGAHIADTALQKFSEFTQGMTGATAVTTFPYASFIKELHKKVKENMRQLTSTCPLSALFYGASCYLRCQQITTAKLASGELQLICNSSKVRRAGPIPGCKIVTLLKW